ncbi:MAG: SPFH/Band 7/PHB domain protein [Eubacterium sp.]|nr:SPFH/Band 7/PHB domain protein [Eubacterium sp.]
MELFGLFMIVFLIVIIVLLLAFNIIIVPQAHEYIIEFLGKYEKTWGAGLHIKIPLLERVASKVSLKEQVLDFEPQHVITKDNVGISVDSVVFCKVFNSKDFTYGVENALTGLENLSATTLRSILGEMDLDNALSGRDQINARMEKVLDESTDPWGLKVTRVELKNIDPPREIAEAMSKQMKAEREKRQTVLEAQAHQESVITRAEGDKKAKVLAAEAECEAQAKIAEGKAEAIKKVYDAEAAGIRMLREAGIDESVLRLKSIEALKDVADGNATKIFMPADISNIVSTAGVIGETLGIGSPAAEKPKTEDPAPEDPCCDDEEE